MSGLCGPATKYAVNLPTSLVAIGECNVTSAHSTPSEVPVPGVGCWVESKVIVATTTVRRVASRFRDAIENVQWSGLCGMTPKPLANHVRDCALKAVVGVRLPPISTPYVLKNSSTVDQAYIVRA